MAVAAVAFGANRWIGAGGFFRDQFDDVLAGVILLSWSNLLARSSPAARLVCSPGGGLAIIAFASVVWELVIPRILPHRTADLLDVLAYIMGALIYLVVRASIRGQSGQRAICAVDDNV